MTRSKKDNDKPLSPQPPADEMLAPDDDQFAVGALAGTLMSEQPLLTVEMTAHEARILAVHQRESALRGIHEAGHVVLAAVLGVRVKSADIGVRHAGDTTLGWHDETELGFITTSRMQNLVVVSLAGIEAERYFLGEITDGGSADLQDATNRCLDMIAAGMDPDVAVSFKSFGSFQSVPHTDWLVNQIARAVDARMRDGRQRARDLMGQHAYQVLGFARLLVTAPNRRLSDERLADALRAVGLEPPPPFEPVGGFQRTRRKRRP